MKFNNIKPNSDIARKKLNEFCSWSFFMRRGQGRVALLLAVLLLITYTVSADPEPRSIYAVCEIELRDGTLHKGFMNIGRYASAIDGFYIYYDENRHYPMEIKQGTVGFDLVKGKRYKTIGSSGERNFGTPTIYYLKDLGFEKGYTFKNEIDLSIQEDVIELTRKNVEKYHLLDSISLVKDLNSIFISDACNEIQDIAVADIRKFTLVIKPDNAIMGLIYKLETDFLKEHENEEEFHDPTPLWYHRIFPNSRGIKKWNRY